MILSLSLFLFLFLLYHFFDFLFPRKCLQFLTPIENVSSAAFTPRAPPASLLLPWVNAAQSLGLDQVTVAM